MGGLGCGEQQASERWKEWVQHLERQEEDGRYASHTLTKPH